MNILWELWEGGNSAAIKIVTTERLVRNIHYIINALYIMLRKGWTAFSPFTS